MSTKTFRRTYDAEQLLGQRANPKALRLLTDDEFETVVTEARRRALELIAEALPGRKGIYEALPPAVERVDVLHRRLEVTVRITARYSPEYLARREAHLDVWD